jgi:mannonate dehydratase
MKLGLGLYRHQLNLEHYRFAKQCGCTHLIVHLVDYFRSSRSNRPGDQPVGDDSGWGLAGDADQLWTLAELTALRQEINDAGLEWEAIENFDPAHWHDVLLDGPKKAQQLENLKTIIRNVGKAGIPVFGYNFSIAGVAGRVKGTFARGQAEAVGMDGPLDQPLPNGMAWNMVYDRNPPPGQAPSATPDQLWQRLQDFLDALIPVAEEAGGHPRRASRRPADAVRALPATPRLSATPVSKTPGFETQPAQRP